MLMLILIHTNTNTNTTNNKRNRRMEQKRNIYLGDKDMSVEIVFSGFSTEKHF